MVLESLESAKRRGAKIYCEIAGFHTNMEGQHILTPTSEGLGIFKSVYYALKEAGIKSNEVDAFNAHAGSTPKGDDSEAQAIKMIAGTDPDKFSKMTINEILSQKDEELDHNNLKRVCVTAWKANMGHCSAGSGALETMFLIMSMNHNEFPEIKNLKNPCEPKLNFAMGENRKMKADVVVKTSLGLGVNCGAIVMRRYYD